VSLAACELSPARGVRALVSYLMRCVLCGSATSAWRVVLFTHTLACCFFLCSLPHHTAVDALLPAPSAPESSSGAGGFLSFIAATVPAGPFAWADAAIAVSANASAHQQQQLEGGGDLIASSVDQPRAEFALAVAQAVRASAEACSRDPGAATPATVLRVVAAAVRNFLALATTLSHASLSATAASVAASSGVTAGALGAVPAASSWFESEADAVVAAGLPLPLGFSAAALAQRRIGLTHYLRVAALEVPALCHAFLAREGCLAPEVLAFQGDRSSSGGAPPAAAECALDFARAGLAAANALARQLAVENLAHMLERHAAAAAGALQGGTAVQWGSEGARAGQSPWQLRPGARRVPTHTEAACASTREALAWACAVMLPADDAAAARAGSAGSASSAIGGAGEAGGLCAQELRAWRDYASALQACDAWLALVSAPLPPGPSLPPALFAMLGGGGGLASSTAASQQQQHISDLDRARFEHAVRMHLGIVDARRDAVSRATAAALAALRALFAHPGGFLHVAAPTPSGAAVQLHDADSFGTAAVLEVCDPMVVDTWGTVPPAAALRGRLVPLLVQVRWGCYRDSRAAKRRRFSRGLTPSLPSCLKLRCTCRPFLMFVRDLRLGFGLTLLRRLCSERPRRLSG
jgi:hypothetical protein